MNRTPIHTVAFVIFFAAGCAVTKFIAEASYPDYSLLHCSGGPCKSKPSVFCTRIVDAGSDDMEWDCVDGAKFMDTLVGQHEHVIEARYSFEPPCACVEFERSVSCECDGGIP